MTKSVCTQSTSVVAGLFISETNCKSVLSVTQTQLGSLFLSSSESASRQWTDSSSQSTSTNFMLFISQRSVETTGDVKHTSCRPSVGLGCSSQSFGRSQVNVSDRAGE